MKRITLSGLSLAALVLAAPIAFAQPSSDQKDDRTPSESKGPNADKSDADAQRGGDRGSARSDNGRSDREQYRDPSTAGQKPAGESRKDARDDAKPSKEKAADENKKSPGGQAGNEKSDDGENGSRSKSPEKADDTTGKKDPRAATNPDRDREDKNQAQRKDQNEDKNQTQRKDQSGDKDKNQAKREQTGDESDRMDSGQARGEVRQEDRQKAEQARSKVDREVRDRVRAVAFRGDVRRADRTDIRIDIGIRLPRTIEVYDLPPDIIAIAPAYRGYRYIVIGDDYCIVDPETYVIIDVIPRTGGDRDQYAYRSGGGSSRLDLTNEQIEIIRRETRNRGKTYDFDGDLEVGIKLPGDYAFEPFPETITVEVPVVRDYRFVHVEDEIAIVAKDHPDVVFVIGD
ncbi:MAG: hypothetical protein C0519_14790 [Hyphomicrobium sp.]|nr:hypothetical protein [Hyphomicrobium sp.]